MRDVLAVYGLKPRKEEVVEKFIFGDGETKTSKFRYVYPVGLGGQYCGKLGQACIDVPCPLLLSRAVMKNWKVNLDFDNECNGSGGFNNKSGRADLKNSFAQN